MLDKNPDSWNSDGLSATRNLINKNSINSLIFDNPFTKILFLTKIISKVNESVFYVDFDLMYSGYIVSELVSIPKNVYLIRPEIKNLNKTIAELTVKISQKKCVVILDSLNGFLNFLGEENPGRLANSYIMLLASNAKMSDSAVIISSISKYKKEEGWVLVPTGRHVMENDNIKKFYLQTSGPSLTISKIENGKHIQIFVVD